MKKIIAVSIGFALMCTAFAGCQNTPATSNVNFKASLDRLNNTVKEMDMVQENELMLNHDFMLDHNGHDARIVPYNSEYYRDYNQMQSEADYMNKHHNMDYGNGNTLTIAHHNPAAAGSRFANTTNTMHGISNVNSFNLPMMGMPSQPLLHNGGIAAPGMMGGAAGMVNPLAGGAGAVVPNAGLNTVNPIAAPNMVGGVVPNAVMPQTVPVSVPAPDAQPIKKPGRAAVSVSANEVTASDLAAEPQIKNDRPRSGRFTSNIDTMKRTTNEARGRTNQTKNHNRSQINNSRSFSANKANSELNQAYSKLGNKIAQATRALEENMSKGHRLSDEQVAELSGYVKVLNELTTQLRQTKGDLRTASEALHAEQNSKTVEGYRKAKTLAYKAHAENRLTIITSLNETLDAIICVFDCQPDNQTQPVSADTESSTDRTTESMTTLTL
ncbi:MAG: hypothetical protein FWE53_04690 [Firmicutes bacterium]|nr:hypothetical protein [Bacillota bacterium]